MADPIIEMANKLADECLTVQKETGQDRLFMEVAKEIGSSSQTLEEAFLTAVRTKMAERTARQFMAQKLLDHRDANPPTDAAGNKQEKVGTVEIIPPGEGD